MLRDIIRRREKKWLGHHHYITYSNSFHSYYCEVCKMEIDDPVLHFWTKHREIWKQARIYALKIVYVEVKEDSA